MTWIGPLFRCELLRLARRGTQPRLRVIYVCLLLIALFVTYVDTFNDIDISRLVFEGDQVPRERMAEFGESFMLAFLFVQIVAVVLLTPVYAGAAITEEKERRSLDFLLSSPLLGREIILGKLLARLVFVFSVLIAGLPVLLFTTFFGGVDPERLLAGFVIAIVAVFGIGCYSLHAGIKRDSLRSVVTHVYAMQLILTIVGVICVCIPVLSSLSPFSAMVGLVKDWYGGVALRPSGSMDLTWINVGLFSLIYLVAGISCLKLAIERIRIAPATRIISRRSAEMALGLPGLIAIEMTEPMEVAPAGLRYRRVPGIEENEDPHLWKERYFTSRIPELERGWMHGCGMLTILWLLFLFFAVLVLLTFSSIAGRMVAVKELNLLIRSAVAFIGTVLPPLMGLRVVGSLGRERQQQTLDSLFLLPTARSCILKAKWLAPLYWARPWLIGTCVVMVLAMMSGVVHPAGTLGALMLLVGYTLFTNTLAVWLSVITRSATSASFIFLVVVLVVNVMPLMMPSAGIWMAMFTWDDLLKDNVEVWAAVIAPVAGIIYALIAGALWQSAVTRFNAEGRKTL